MRLVLALALLFAMLAGCVHYAQSGHSSNSAKFVLHVG